MSNGILMEMTIEDVQEFNPEVVVIGVGSVEAHGPVLPYGTDTYGIDRIVRDCVIKANEQGARALMYPTLPIGNNVNFKAFPFACRIGVQTLMQVFLDIFRALEEDGIRKIVIVNGHGGNTDTLHAALRAHTDITPPERRAFVCLKGGGAPPGVIKHPSNHAGESEVSRMMYVREDLVRKDKIDNYEFGEITVDALKENVHFVKPWHLHVPAACGGDQRESSKDKGQQLYEHGTKTLAEFLVALTDAPWHENFPYKA